MMLILKKVKRFLALAGLFVLATFNSYSQSQNEMELREFCFEIARCSVTGFSPVASAEKFFSLSRKSSSLLMRRIWKKEESGPLYLYEVLFPQKAGVIESTIDESSFNNEYSDLWIDSSILTLKAAREIYTPKAGDLLSLLDGKSEGALIDEDEDEIINILRDGELRKFSYKGEKLSVTKSEDKLQLTNVSDELIVRRSYDETLRLVKKEVFNSPSSYDNLELKILTSYYYENDSTVLKNTVEENKTEKSRTDTFFNASGKQEKQEVFRYEEVEKTPVKKVPPEETSEKETVEYVPVKKSKTLWNYDEENRLSKVSHTDYYYSKNSKGKKSVTQKEQVKEFTYNKSSRPDSDYYEDGQLRVRLVYSDENDYTETLLFDDGFSVVNTYVDGNRVLEVIFANDVEMRRKTFEQL